jgi:hypothetical protein
MKTKIYIITSTIIELDDNDFENYEEMKSKAIFEADKIQKSTPNSTTIDIVIENGSVTTSLKKTPIGCDSLGEDLY